MPPLVRAYLTRRHRARVQREHVARVRDALKIARHHRRRRRGFSRGSRRVHSRIVRASAPIMKSVGDDEHTRAHIIRNEDQKGGKAGKEKKKERKRERKQRVKETLVQRQGCY